MKELEKQRGEGESGPNMFASDSNGEPILLDPVNPNNLKQLANNFKIRYQVSNQVEVIEGKHLAAARAHLKTARPGYKIQ